MISLLARSYGLSLVVNSLAGLGYLYSGVWIPSRTEVYLAISLVTLLFIVGYRYKFRIPQMQKGDLARTSLVLLLAFTFGALVLSEFLKYPLFPKTLSVDFIQHARLVDSALAGGPGNLSWALLYGGVHLNLALGAVLVGGYTVIQLPVLMALLAAPSSLLFYEVCRLLYGSRSRAS